MSSTGAARPVASWGTGTTGNPVPVAFCALHSRLAVLAACPFCPAALWITLPCSAEFPQLGRGGDGGSVAM